MSQMLYTNSCSPLDEPHQLWRSVNFSCWIRTKYLQNIPISLSCTLCLELIHKCWHAKTLFWDIKRSKHYLLIFNCDHIRMLMLAFSWTHSAQIQPHSPHYLLFKPTNTVVSPPLLERSSFVLPSSQMGTSMVPIMRVHDGVWINLDICFRLFVWGNSALKM